MLTNILFVFLALSASVAAHGHNELSALYKAYQQSKTRATAAQPLQTKAVISPSNTDKLREKSLFVPPRPGQNGVDYHPQLRVLADTNATTAMTYYSWHVHVYFFHEDKNVTDRTLALRDQFIATFNLPKCDDECFMGGWMDSCTQGMCVWDPFYGVDGPHPYGQWGVYMPNEMVAETISWMSANHGEFDVLFHPNTGYMVGDHAQRTIWIKQMVPLDADFLVWLQCEWYDCSDEVVRAKALM